MEARLGRAADAPDDVALFIRHDHHHRRLDLALLGAQLIERRIRRLRAVRLVALALIDLRLGLLALFAAAFQIVLQVVREEGAERRVRRGEVRLPLKRLARQPELRPLDVQLRVARREDRRFVGGDGRRHRAQRPHVIEHPEAAAERGDDEIVAALLKPEVAHRDGRKIALERNPRRAAVLRDEEAVLRPQVEELRIDAILHERIDAAARGKVPPDRDPCLPAVATPKHVRFEVAGLVVVEGGVDDVGVMLRRLEPRDVRHVGHAGDVIDLPPVPAAVFGDLNQAVVGADVDQPLLQRRLGQRDDVAVPRRRCPFGHGIDTPHPPHDRQLVAVDVAGEIGADRFPGVAAIVAAEEILRGEVDAVAVVRADDERRVPVQAQRLHAAGRLRLDVERLAGALVEAHQAAVLRFGIDDVLVLRVGDGAEAVAALRDVPVGVGDPLRIRRARRAAEAEVVLRAAVDAVEGKRVVGADAVELRDGEVGFEVPRLGAVE